MTNTRNTSSAPIQNRRTIPQSLPLPPIPKSASPVPWLSSLHVCPNRGPYGDATYRGNCSGYLIEDLLRYFHPRNVLDPFSGSGTCRDVCRTMKIPCRSFDLKDGTDACDSASYQGMEPVDFIWMHPPYWQMIRYSDDPRCLSNAKTLDAFLKQLRHIIAHCKSVLTPEGTMAILMGNYQRRGCFVPLTYLTMQVCLDEGLWPACTDIVHLLYNATSATREYPGKLIPGVHDVCMIFEPLGDQAQTLGYRNAAS